MILSSTLIGCVYEIEGYLSPLQLPPVLLCTTLTLFVGTQHHPCPQRYLDLPYSHAISPHLPPPLHTSSLCLSDGGAELEAMESLDHERLQSVSDAVRILCEPTPCFRRH